MSIKRTAAFVALLAVGIAACDQLEEITGLTIDDLVGTWDASTLTYSPTETDSESQPIPFVTLGGDLVVTIADDGSFSGTLTVPGALTPTQEPADLPVSGQMTLTQDAEDNDVIDVNFDQTTEGVFTQAGLPFEDFDGPIDYTSTQITVTNETTFDFDLGGPNAEEPASLLLVMNRDAS